MARRKGFYVPLAVDTMDDDRVLSAGPDAELLWYRLLQFVKRTNPAGGTVTTRQVLRLHPKGKAAHGALVDVGLLRPAGDENWALAGWFTWNETPEQIEQARERKVKAGRKGAASRWQDDDTGMAAGIVVPSQRHGSVPSFCHDTDMANGWHVPSLCHGTDMANDGYNDNDNDNDNNNPCRSMGTSSVLSVAGLASHFRNDDDPAPVATSLAGLLGRMR